MVFKQEVVLTQTVKVTTGELLGEDDTAYASHQSIRNCHGTAGDRSVIEAYWYDIAIWRLDAAVRAFAAVLWDGRIQIHITRTAVSISGDITLRDGRSDAERVVTIALFTLGMAAKVMGGRLSPLIRPLSH